VLTKKDAKKLRIKAEAEKETVIAKKIAIGQKKEEQALRKT
jgi:hypothetical protein